MKKIIFLYVMFMALNVTFVVGCQNSSETVVEESGDNELTLTTDSSIVSTDESIENKHDIRQDNMPKTSGKMIIHPYDDDMEVELSILDGTYELMVDDYTVNEDGTYTCNGKKYKYKKNLFGKLTKLNLQGYFGYYTVLTNYDGLSFDDIYHHITSGPRKFSIEESVILDYVTLVDEDRIQNPLPSEVIS